MKNEKEKYRGRLGRTELSTGSWIVDVPFQTGLVVWLGLFSSLCFCFGGQELRQDDLVDEEDEVHSSSSVLILALECEISAA